MQETKSLSSPMEIAHVPVARCAERKVLKAVAGDVDVPLLQALLLRKKRLRNVLRNAEVNSKCESIIHLSSPFSSDQNRFQCFYQVLLLRYRQDVFFGPPLQLVVSTVLCSAHVLPHDWDGSASLL